MLVIRAGIHEMLVRIRNREDLDQTAPRSSLVWNCVVCLGLFGRQRVFEILEHLPYIPHLYIHAPVEPVYKYTTVNVLKF